jgi:hypothetical protein
MDQTGKNGAAISMIRSDSNRQPEERHEIMTDEPVDLDEHRGMAAQVATDVRRQRLHEFQVDQAALRRRQEELEKLRRRPRPRRSILYSYSPPHRRLRTRATRSSSPMRSTISPDCATARGSRYDPLSGKRCADRRGCQTRTQVSPVPQVPSYVPQRVDRRENLFSL